LHAVRFSSNPYLLPYATTVTSTQTFTVADSDVGFWLGTPHLGVSKLRVMQVVVMMPLNAAILFRGCVQRVWRNGSLLRVVMGAAYNAAAAAAAAAAVSGFNVRPVTAEDSHESGLELKARSGM